MKFKAYIHKITGEFAWVEIKKDKLNMVNGYWVTSNVPKLFPETHTFEVYKEHLNNTIQEWEAEPIWGHYELVDVEIKVLP